MNHHHPAAFFDSKNALRDWHTGVPLAPDWTGFAKGTLSGLDTIFYIGREDAERTFNALVAKTMAQAQTEAVLRGLCAAPDEGAPTRNDYLVTAFLELTADRLYGLVLRVQVVASIQWVRTHAQEIAERALRHDIGGKHPDRPIVALNVEPADPLGA